MAYDPANPLAGWDPYAFVADRQALAAQTAQQRALEDAWKQANPAPEYASQYDAYSSPWYDASLGQDPSSYMGQVYRAEGRYSPTDGDGNTVGNPLMFQQGKGYALTDKSGKVLAKAATPAELEALAAKASGQSADDWYVFGTDDQGNFDFNPGTALYDNTNKGSFESMIIPMLAIAGAGFGLSSLGLGAAGGAGAGGLGGGAGLGAGAGGAGGGLGGVGGALSGAGGAIGGAGAGLGGITVVGAPGIGLGTGLAGGALGLGGMAGLSQLANPVASTGAASGSTGTVGAAPGDIVVTGAPTSGLSAAEVAAATGAATGGAGAAAVGAGGAPPAELPPAEPPFTGEIVVPGTAAPTIPVAPIAAIGGAGALAAAAGGAGGAPAGATPTGAEAGAGAGDIVVTGAPTSGGNIVAGIGAGAGAAGVANAVAGANGGTGGGGGGNGGGLGLSDYLTLGSLAIGGLGNLLGGGGGGANGTIPAGFGAGAGGDIFNKPLPTLPATSPFAPQNLGPRDVSKTYDQWVTGGYGAPTSYFNHVPLQSTPSVTQPYTKPAASVTMPDVRIPTLASVPTPRAPGADLLAAMLGQQPAGMARGGRTHGAPSHSTDSFAVRGPGAGREDKIPAALSDGEYVMDAETVALLGDGSTDAGAEKLDQFRVNIRKHKGRKLAKGKFSANAKRPDAYLAGGLT